MQFTLTSWLHFALINSPILFVVVAIASDHFVLMEPFASNLRKRASELGVSNAEIARRLGVSERRYAHYVRGDREPDLATLTRIAAVFRLSTDELLGLSEPSESSECDVLRGRLISASEALSERDLRVLVAAAEAVANLVRGELARQADN